jgi:nitrogen-specific signal transduction histidine kinase
MGKPSDPERPPSTAEDQATRMLVHDLRSSLTGIMGMAALIERTNDVAKAREWAAQIGTACDRLEARIDAIGRQPDRRPHTDDGWADGPT